MTDPVIDAIHDGRLAAWAAANPEHPFGARALATCERIGRSLATEATRLSGLLGDAGVAVEPPTSTAAQRRVITFDVEFADLDRAIETLAAEGYERRHTWRRGAERSFRRVAHEIHLDRSDTDATTVVRLRWSERRSGRLARLVDPTPADWATVTLPSRLWWAYPAVRVVRLIAERTGLRTRDHGLLEPFLVTPASLLKPVLDVAEVGAGDVVLDFGCGDGRFLVEAAASFGCRAVGVDQSASRVAAARERIAGLGLADRVAVEQGDASRAALEQITVVVLFVPTVVARRVLPVVLDRARPGTRIVLHEQSPLPPDLPAPMRSVPIVTDDAATVAHCWSARPAGRR